MFEGSDRKHLSEEVNLRVQNKGDIYIVLNTGSSK